jgi:serine protease Do
MSSESSTLPPQPTETTTPGETAPLTQKRASRSSACLFRLIPLFLVALIGGYLGGALSRPFSPFSFERLFPVPKIDETKESPATPLVLPAEDQAVVAVVERSLPGVVSIVVTKDVPRVRNFFRAPFGFPFFSDPFTQGEGSDEESTRRTVGSGSGFFTSADGLIITNKHVVSDSRAEYTVITSDGKEYPAQVLALDPVNDLAVIKIEGSGFPALPLGDSDALRVGQTAIAIGNPLGEFANSVSRGIISGLERSVIAGTLGDSEELRDIIQTDAAINPGNSGGPLLNLGGEVVGVNVAVAQGAENIGFAIPVNQLKRSVDEVRRTGKITAPYLGVRYVILNEAIATEADLPVEYGALIQRGERITDFAVIPGSPADKAGLMENDIILEIDGQRIDERNTLSILIAGKRVGDEVVLNVWHKGETKEVRARLEERKS